MRLAAAAWILASLIGACGGGGGATPAPGPAAPPGTRSQSAIASAETGITYTYQVYLPPGYAQSTRRYPVIYAADGEYRFPVLSAILEAQRREAILVNVWHMGADRRWVDFTMPGADAYFRFLTRELIPAIDSMYRTDTAHRTFSGHSLSGLFAVYALYLDGPGPRTFQAIISGDGSFWARPDRVFETLAGAEPATTMELRMFERDRNLQVRLVLAGQNASTGVTALYSYLAARGYPNLRLSLGQYGLGHLEMDGPSFQDALPFIYDNP